MEKKDKCFEVNGLSLKEGDVFLFTAETGAGAIEEHRWLVERVAGGSMSVQSEDCLSAGYTWYENDSHNQNEDINVVGNIKTSPQLWNPTWLDSFVYDRWWVLDWLVKKGMR